MFFSDSASAKFKTAEIRIPQSLQKRLGKKGAPAAIKTAEIKNLTVGWWHSYGQRGVVKK